MTQNALFCLDSLLHRSPLCCFLTIVSCHAGIFSNVSHSFSTAAFASGNFSARMFIWKTCVHQIVGTQWIHTSSVQTKRSFHASPHRFIGFPYTCHVEVCKALRLASEFPFFYAHLSWYPWIPHHQDQWSKYHAIFWHCRALVSRSATVASLCVSMHRTHVSTSLPTKCLAWRSFAFLSVSPRPCILRINMFFQQYIQWCSRNPGHVDILQWDRKWFFSRGTYSLTSGFHVMTVNNIASNGPEGLKKTRLILLQDFLVLLVGLWSRIKVDVLSSWSPRTNFIRPSATGNMNYPFWVKKLLPLRWVFLRRFQMRPSPPFPQCMQPVRHPSKFTPAYNAYPRNNPGKTFFPNWWMLDWSFAVIG